MSADVTRFRVIKGGRRPRSVSVTRGRQETAGQKFARLRRRDPFASSVVETMIDNLLARLDAKDIGA